MNTFFQSCINPPDVYGLKMKTQNQEARNQRLRDEECDKLRQFS